MWESLSKPWQACVEQAWEAYCAGSIPIGAVIAGQDGEIIVGARNRRYEENGFPFKANNQEVMHAEIQAILAMNDRQVARGTAELYTTMEPCPMCLGTWYMSNMDTLHYAARDPFAGSVNLLEATWYLRHKGKQAHGPADPWFENILIGLSVETEFRVRGGLLTPLRARWEPLLAAGIKFGETLSSDPQLKDLRESHGHVREGFNYLVTQQENFEKRS